MDAVGWERVRGESLLIPRVSQRGQRISKLSSANKTGAGRVGGARRQQGLQKGSSVSEKLSCLHQLCPWLPAHCTNEQRKWGLTQRASRLFKGKPKTLPRAVYLGPALASGVHSEP